MKYFKNYFGVFGPVSILRAFIEEAKQLGWVEYGHYDLETEKTLWFDGPCQVRDVSSYWVPFQIRVRAENIFELPQQWEEAMKLLSESESEEEVKERLRIGKYKPLVNRKDRTITYGCQTFTKDQVLAIREEFDSLTKEKLDQIISVL